MAFLALTVILACSKQDHEIVVVLNNSHDAFASSLVADFIVRFQSVDHNGQVLDLNNDRVADTFLFPSTCTNSSTPACGYDPNQSGRLSFASLPQNFKYQIEVKFRNATGDILFEGSSDFVNTADLKELNINVEQVP